MTPLNSKFWIYFFEWEGKRKKITIGNFKKSSTTKEVGYTLEEARKAKEKFKLMLQNGVCPQNEKKALKTKQIQEVEKSLIANEKILSNIINDYFQFITSITERHKEKQRSQMNRMIIPFLGNKSIDDITAQNLLECILKIKSDGQKHRVLTLCGQIWKWAKSNYRTQTNITLDIDRKNTLPPEPKAENFKTITEKDKIKILLKMIEQYDGDISTKTALRLAPYVALRPFNIRFAEWTEFNFEDKLWIIPASKMKMKKEHIVPLTDSMINIINDIKPFSFQKSIYLFPSPISNLKTLSENTLNYGLKRLGYGDEIVAHGFRAMFSTITNEFIDDDDAHGVSRDIIEFQLAHKIDNKVGAAYNRALYLKQRTRLMQWWSDYLDDLKKI